MAYTVGTLGPRASSPPAARFGGQWTLLIVRTALVIYLGAVVALHVVTIPTVFEIQRTACEPGACFWGQVNGDTRDWLSDRGISPLTYAVIATLIPLLIPIVGHTLAGIAIWQRPTNWLPTLFLLGLAFCTVSASGAIWILLIDHPEWTRPFLTLHGLMYITGVLMTLLFPDGRFVPRWGWLLLVPAVIDTVFLTEPSLLVRLPDAWQRGWEIWWQYSEFAAIGIIAWRIHVTVDRRALRQTRIWFGAQVPMWIYIALVIVFYDGNIDAISSAGYGEAILHQFVWAFGILFFLAGLLMAIYLYNIYDLSVVLRRSLVYGLLSISLVGLYLVTVGTMSVLLGGGDSAVPALLATAVIAIAFAPLRTWLQDRVHRLLYGDRQDPYGVLTRFGHHLQETAAPDRLLRTIVELAQDALRVPGVALAVTSTPALGVHTGSVTADAVHVPVRYQGDDLGTLSVVPRTPAEPFSPADRRLIDEIARQTGIAVHSVLLSEDLRKSRERIVTAREEERRRIRRDLHDGLGPSLAALSLQIEIARDLVAVDPDRSRDLLEDVLSQSRDAIIDIRRLVYDLRPPALDDLGLLAALRAQASRYEHDGLRVVLDLPETLPPLSAAVEVAVYRIVQEALTNVVRHARATIATVRLACEPDRLEVTIADDGQGIPARITAGIGLRSMRERASELGGTCEVWPRPEGGTTVYARFNAGDGREGTR
jgi:signal transduction histidine kinase